MSHSVSIFPFLFQSLVFEVHSFVIFTIAIGVGRGKFGEKFYSTGSRAGLLIRLRVCKGALRRREHQKLRWLDGITNSMDRS